ncbi:hypothetical protein PRIPAC_90642 [Pristionchus pacificus]|uniref:Uncharacterized protein n=1 Tax=Pristionchus pacificus TaxID=54126 RepID=A0A2A6B828_PRIPA|nr:hypothetical protein PRIPAC_90642 [Pristionchus pacificus]|eukprot:PDM62026.1 hypothetical protein PRIPAC_51468 [Pristionchus pacificus]
MCHRERRRLKQLTSEWNIVVILDGEGKGEENEWAVTSSQRLYKENEREREIEVSYRNERIETRNEEEEEEDRSDDETKIDGREIKEEKERPDKGVEKDSLRRRRTEERTLNSEDEVCPILFSHRSKKAGIYEMFGSKTAMIAEKLLFGVRKSRKKESARRLMITRGKEKGPSRRGEWGRRRRKVEEKIGYDGSNWIGVITRPDCNQSMEEEKEGRERDEGEW